MIQFQQALYIKKTSNIDYYKMIEEKHVALPCLVVICICQQGFWRDHSWQLNTELYCWRSSAIDASQE